MGMLQVVAATGEDYGAAKSHHQTGFEVNSGAVKREVGDQELALSYFGDDDVADFVVVFLRVHAQRGAAASFDAQPEAVRPRPVQDLVEGHCYKHLFVLSRQQAALEVCSPI
jgi:hypothetical protein